MLGVAPILPSRDLTSTADFYARLGFEQRGAWPGEYLIVHAWGGGSALLPGVGARPVEVDRSACPQRASLAPEDTDYGLREFALVDPDGNLLPVGSR
jgi:catechol 2,3-dioxygenase-like lactoylglutathione lyase family enzyme